MARIAMTNESQLVQQLENLRTELSDELSVKYNPDSLETIPQVEEFAYPALYTILMQFGKAFAYQYGKEAGTAVFKSIFNSGSDRGPLDWSKLISDLMHTLLPLIKDIVDHSMLERDMDRVAESLVTLSRQIRIYNRIKEEDSNSEDSDGYKQALSEKMALLDEFGINCISESRRLFSQKYGYIGFELYVLSISTYVIILQEQSLLRGLNEEHVGSFLSDEGEEFVQRLNAWYQWAMYRYKFEVVEILDHAGSDYEVVKCKVYADGKLITSPVHEHVRKKNEPNSWPWQWFGVYDRGFKRMSSWLTNYYGRAQDNFKAWSAMPTAGKTIVYPPPTSVIKKAAHDNFIPVPR